MSELGKLLSLQISPLKTLENQYTLWTTSSIVNSFIYKILLYVKNRRKFRVKCTSKFIEILLIIYVQQIYRINCSLRLLTLSFFYSKINGTNYIIYNHLRIVMDKKVSNRSFIKQKTRIILNLTEKSSNFLFHLL